MWDKEVVHQLKHWAKQLHCEIVYEREYCVYYRHDVVFNHAHNVAMSKKVICPSGRRTSVIIAGIELDKDYSWIME